MCEGLCWTRRHCSLSGTPLGGPSLQAGLRKGGWALNRSCCHAPICYRLPCACISSPSGRQREAETRWEEFEHLLRGPWSPVTSLKANFLAGWAPNCPPRGSPCSAKYRCRRVFRDEGFTLKSMYPLNRGKSLGPSIPPAPGARILLSPARLCSG